MVFELKKPTNSVPGLLVFSHKEYLKFLNTKVAKFFLSKLKENYFIGIHWGASFKTIPINKQVDIHFALPGLLPNTSELEEKVIPLTTRNFTPSSFAPQKEAQKDWDVITVGRKVKVKRYLEFFLIIKKVFETKPNARVLVISPKDEHPKRSTEDFLFDENYNNIFSDKEKQQIDIYSDQKSLGTKEIIDLLNRSKTFLFTSTQEGVAKVTAEAALCGLKVLIYKDFIGSATYGIDSEQLYLYEDLEDASTSIIKFIDEEIIYTLSNDTIREEYSLIKLDKYLDTFYNNSGFDYDNNLNSNDLRNNLNSFNQSLPSSIVINNSNDLKNLRAFVMFCELNSIKAPTYKKLYAVLYDILLIIKELYRKRKNLLPLFVWRAYRRRNQYKKLAI